MTDLNRISNAPVNTDINVNNNIKIDQDNTIQKNLPNELQNARPSTMAKLGRIMLGIFTLGISEAIRAIVNHASKGNVSEPRIEQNPIENIGVQEHKPKMLNTKGLLYQMRAEKPNLDPVYKNAVADAYKEVQKNFPDFKGSSFDDYHSDDNFMNTRHAKSIELSLEKYGKDKNITPEEFKQAVVESMLEDIKAKAIEEQVKSFINDIPGAEKLSAREITLFSRSIKNITRDTDLGNNLVNASNPDQVKEAINNLKDVIKNSLEVRANRKSKEAEYVNKGVELIANKTGLTKEQILPMIEKSRLPGKLAMLGTLIADGAKKCANMQEYDVALNKIMKKFVSEMSEMIDQINALDINDNTRKELYNELLTNAEGISANANIYKEIYDFVGKMSNELTELKDILRNKGDTRAILNEILGKIWDPLEKQILLNPDNTLGKDWRGIGKNEGYSQEQKSSLFFTMTQILFDKDPEIKELLLSYDDFSEKMYEETIKHRQEIKPPVDASNEAIKQFNGVVNNGHVLINTLSQEVGRLARGR